MATQPKRGISRHRMSLIPKWNAYFIYIHDVSTSRRLHQQIFSREIWNTHRIGNKAFGYREREPHIVSLRWRPSPMQMSFVLCQCYPICLRLTSCPDDIRTCDAFNFYTRKYLGRFDALLMWAVRPPSFSSLSKIHGFFKCWKQL